MHVRAKKHLGQHFLTDPHLAQKIVDSLRIKDPETRVLEIGPGKGVLTQYLLEKYGSRFLALDIDSESIEYLHHQYSEMKDQLILGDFLQTHGNFLSRDTWAIIGNFPYNISSQIIFKILENRIQVVEMVGMFQKEVAERFRAKPSTKEYGILSVLVQAFYKGDYLFSVKPGSFYPPPKVNSAVVRLNRLEKFQLDCDEDLFFKVVKAGFNQRRKTLRNALQGDFPGIKNPEAPYFSVRAEALNVSDFVILSRFLSQEKNKPSQESEIFL
jgi:16S rRNA (adenine1518-N6/adenine1519-N6)-dimethyltransferase